jgi:hypothetical protein
VLDGRPDTGSWDDDAVNNDAADDDDAVDHHPLHVDAFDDVH